MIILSFFEVLLSYNYQANYLLLVISYNKLVNNNLLPITITYHILLLITYISYHILFQKAK